MTMTTTPTQELSPFLTEAQAAARFGLKPKTLRNWRSAGTGPQSLKLGSAVRYHQATLDSWALSLAAKMTVAVAA
ncbi:helix-turn-helix domain-containing protein [Cryobacterium sp. CG_9.6]|uniref:helix-turn-helix transcriptional regulator n=1 Tax=Cryobacterium sp. CG_9.6 TaxID=2760710 RepID=UPI002476A3BE|nr:helix-turn-helix domain-containing protein [Cryobacterium sp. CG_9.6]MDH6236263.1 putative DNA-binding transcriptional regulator AlpA [Cryobacterium sp. CG_9.6]